MRCGVAVAALTLLTATSALVQAPAASAEAWREAQYYLDDYGVYEAWEETRGEGITIAIIDTGVDAEHPALEDAVVGGTDVSGRGEDDGSPIDGQMAPWHGTAVAALAAGRGQPAVDEDSEDLPDSEEIEDLDRDDDDDSDSQSQTESQSQNQSQSRPQSQSDSDDDSDSDSDSDSNDDDSSEDGGSDEDSESSSQPDYDEYGAGIIGVAPEADILSVSMFLESPNPQGPNSDDQIAEAVTWAVDNGADIINMSVGSGVQEWPQSWDEAFLYAAENDVLVVASAGNRGSGHMAAGAPATIPGVLAVAGVDEDRNISALASTQGIAVDIAAAGEDIPGAMPDSDNIMWDGTSAAAPIVSGAAALVWAANPDLSAPEVAHRLMQTADPESDDEIDPEYGRGVLNVAEAVLSEDVPEFNPEDYETLEEWIRVHRRDNTDNDDAQEVPEGSGIISGPEGEPRERPEASQSQTVQDWAGPVVISVTGLLVLAVVAGAAVHLSSRGSRN